MHVLSLGRSLTPNHFKLVFVLCCRSCREWKEHRSQTDQDSTQSWLFPTGAHQLQGAGQEGNRLSFKISKWHKTLFFPEH